MGRRARARRIHPKDGRYTNGAWQPEYAIGCEVGEAARSKGDASMLPTVVSVPAQHETIDRSYMVHNVSAHVVEVDPDGWSYMPEHAPAGKRKARKVLLAPKVWYAESRYVGQEVRQTEVKRHQKQYLGRGRAFHQGVAKALDGLDPELTGHQQAALIAVTRDECERRGIDWRKYVKTGRDWATIAKALQMGD